MANPFSNVMDLFEDKSVPVLSEVPLRSIPGFCYIYQWQESSKKEKWRRDDNRWKQDEWSKQFKKSAYTHLTYEK
ncbi:hypothetical protein OUZ56_016634 [Daphnia magna]|uniref:Uncharacterized protein n=1 Tax=Daphnia magna TaxID=35525 RepID=A0ABR0AR52_9CRUS|nr:hypothetical protein OUZ56_016634 [Daphnia magna]